jgi:hypothetical protein
MKKLISTGLLVVIMVTLSANSPANVSENEAQAIAKIRNAAAKAYNTKDIDALMSHWHQKGGMIERTGVEVDIVSGFGEIRASYLALFKNPEYKTVSHHHEELLHINELYIDSGTISAFNENGKEVFRGCYLMTYIKEEATYKIWREWTYPYCMMTAIK